MDTKTGMTVLEGATRLAEVCVALETLRATSVPNVRIALEDAAHDIWGKATLVSRSRLIELLVAEEQYVGGQLAKLLKGYYE
jgi:hypothetical protein